MWKERGPAECWELARLMEARRASRVLARNEGAGELIFSLGGAPAPLRASQRSTESVVGVVGAWDGVAICVTSVTGVARAGGDFARGVVDVVGWEGKLDEGVA